MICKYNIKENVIILLLEGKQKIEEIFSNVVVSHSNLPFCVSFSSGKVFICEGVRPALVSSKLLLLRHYWQPQQASEERGERSGYWLELPSEVK